MKHAISILMILGVAGFFACKQAPKITNEALVEGYADDVFGNIVNKLEANGFSTDSVSASDRTIRTGFKEFPANKLLVYEKLKEHPSRYSRGRYAYNILVSEAEGKTKVTVNAIVEAYFKPSQATSSSFGTEDQDWMPGESTGKAEEEFLKTIAK